VINMNDTTITAAIEHTGCIAAQVRGQFFARLAFPWRFEAYPLAELAAPPRDSQVEAWIDELDFRCLQALERDTEL
jgi:hypothetical protein